MTKEEFLEQQRSILLSIDEARKLFCALIDEYLDSLGDTETTELAKEALLKRSTEVLLSQVGLLLQALPS